jgi:hypothetical protein
MGLDGWFNLVRRDGTQPSGYPRDHAKGLRSMYAFASLCAVALLILLVLTPPTPVLVVFLPALVTGLLFCAFQVHRLRGLT